MSRDLHLLVLVIAGLTGCRDPVGAPAPVADQPVTRDAAVLFQTDSLTYALAATPSGYAVRIGVDSRIGRRHSILRQLPWLDERRPREGDRREVARRVVADPSTLFESSDHRLTLTVTMKRTPAKTSKARIRTPKASPAKPVRSTEQLLEETLGWLKRNGTKANRDGMARYAIPSDKALGVSVGTLKKLARELGPNHELAEALWETGWYEARMLASFVGEPARVTPALMDRWAKDFDNWAVVDTACFALFDRTPHAWRKVEQWSRKRDEFGKRAAFALLWGLTVHDKQSGDGPFIKSLALIERAASDERHWVKLAVNMALRAIGKRTPELNVAAVGMAERLADAPDATARWVGNDALRELTGASVTRRIKAKKSAVRRA